LKSFFIKKKTTVTDFYDGLKMKVPLYIRHNYSYEVMLMGFDRLNKNSQILLVFVQNDQKEIY
jgi:hypothetical protein